MKQYKIRKEFIGGILKGLTCEEVVPYKREVGFTCTRPVGNTSPYKVVACEELPEAEDKFFCKACGKIHSWDSVRKGNFTYYCPETLGFVHISNKVELQEVQVG